MSTKPDEVSLRVETVDKVRSTYETLLVVRNNHRHLNTAVYQYDFEKAVMDLLEEAEANEQ